jgi:hypothetical protein
MGQKTRADYPYFAVCRFWHTIFGRLVRGNEWGPTQLITS